jgi:hypothetical protein
LTEGRPTHAIWREHGVELVFPDGYDPVNLVELPPGFHDQPMQADVATRSFQVDWSDYDAALFERIDAEAGAFRLQFITDVPGQQATYQTKEQEALDYGVNGLVDPAYFPLLSAEAVEIGTPLDQLVVEVLTLATQWRWINAKVEGRRIGAKARVRQAATYAAKQEAAAIDWWGLIAPPPASTSPAAGKPLSGSLAK